MPSMGTGKAAGKLDGGRRSGARYCKSLEIRNRNTLDQHMRRQVTEERENEWLENIKVPKQAFFLRPTRRICPLCRQEARRQLA